MIKKIIYLLIMLPICVSGQDYMESGWSFNYFAEFYNHPGLKIGYEKAFAQKIKSKVKHDNQILTHKQKIARLSAIYYYHKNNHHGIALIPEISFKKVNHKGYFRSYTYGLGIHQSILPGPIFKQNTDGSFTEHIAGQTTGMGTIDLTIGRDLRFYKGKDYSWHLGFGGFFRFPFNGLFVPGTFIHAGFTHYPSKSATK